MERGTAVSVVEDILETVMTAELPVPVQEFWVYGDVALGLDPIDRLDLYVTKDLLLTDTTTETDFDVDGIGSTVRADWAETYPEYIRVNDAGYAAPERCLGAQLLDDVDGPVHLEVCNTSFEDNVTQRIAGAKARDAWAEALDPRGVCLWKAGTESEDALEKLRAGEFAFPTLPEAIHMVGVSESAAETAATVIEDRRADADDTSIRGDVV